MRDRTNSGLRGAVAVAISATLLGLGCATNTGTIVDKKATQGAIAGTVAGAAVGAAVDKDKRGRGAVIGAVAGGIAGGLIGNYLDRQAREIQSAIPDAVVERRQETLLVTLPGDVLFDSGSAALAPGSYEQLRSFAGTLSRYPESDVIVRGHTDSTGSDDSNLQLSQRRAEHVRDYLVAEGVASTRLRAIGMGEAYPLVSNDTPAGRQRNRRVEFEIRPRQSVNQPDVATPPQ